MSDIGSNDKENCLYVTDSGEQCVWKITEEIFQHNIVKWLTIIDYGLHHCTLYVSSLGNLLIAGIYLSHLNIYGSDAEHQSIQLPTGIKYLNHAVETSIGNFIILHTWIKTEEEGVIAEGWGIRGTERMYVLSELTRDGRPSIYSFE